MKKSQKKNKISPELEKDPTFRLKYIGFCQAVRPSLEEKVSISDFVNFAKFQMCAEYKIPMKADIWDKYTKEEILAEFFALKFHNDKEEAKAFEAELLGLADDDFAWMSKQVKENQKNIKKLKEAQKDFNFSPKDLTEKDIKNAKEKLNAK